MQDTAKGIKTNYFFHRRIKTNSATTFSEKEEQMLSQLTFNVTLKMGHCH